MSVQEILRAIEVDELLHRGPAKLLPGDLPENGREALAQIAKSEIRTAAQVTLRVRSAR